MAVLSMRDYDSRKKIVVFDVREEIWIDDYVIQDTTYDADGNPSNKQPHQVHFPTEQLNVGDTLELHLTKTRDHGAYYMEELSDDKKRLVVYAQFDRIINKTGDTLKLMHIVKTFRLPPSD